MPMDLPRGGVGPARPLTAPHRGIRHLQGSRQGWASVPAASLPGCPSPTHLPFRPSLLLRKREKCRRPSGPSATAQELRCGTRVCPRALPTGRARPRRAHEADTHREEPLLHGRRVDLVPVSVLGLALVHEVAQDGRAPAEPRHLPAERHGVAIAVQERDPVRVRRDSCGTHARYPRVPVSLHHATQGWGEWGAETHPSPPV